jgi:hypothetical protein
MARSLGRRIAVLFLLAVFLGAPWAAAEPRVDRAAASPQLLVQLWSWLNALWGEEGCMLDPSGRCGKTSAPSHLDIGCGIDTDGRCGGAPAPSHLDVGCMLDPNGGCEH